MQTAHSGYFVVNTWSNGEITGGKGKGKEENLHVS